MHITITGRLGSGKSTVCRILAAKYGGNAHFAAGCVTVSTLLSLLAIPAWCLVLLAV